MEYNKVIKLVIDYIGENFDDNIGLEDLCKISGFSKFHFHRIFTATVGISLKNYVRNLRLRRAAHQLIFNKRMRIIDIAIEAGFESHESFTRAFKNQAGVSPNEFRSNGTFIDFSLPLTQTIMKGENIMNVTIKHINKRRLAVIEHRGEHKLLPQTLMKLISWAEVQTIDVMPKAGRSYGFGYNDPHEVSPDEFRFDLAVSVPDDFNISIPMSEKVLPTGEYASIMHKGPREDIGETIYAFYREWLPVSGRVLADYPCVFLYHNLDNEVPSSEALTELLFLCKS
jgi:AraC family transcriptional regulator